MRTIAAVASWLVVLVAGLGVLGLGVRARAVALDRHPDDHQRCAHPPARVDTVRFYERRGVLPTAQRRPSGYREFTPSTVQRIRTAKAMQDLGFTLDEIVDALHTHDTGDATCASERWRLEAVVDRFDARIAELQRARAHVSQALDDCRTGRCQLIVPLV